ncbi:MAG: twin-arginine translocase TatA/TatE family subunit [Anaerolineae bacterium]
MPQLGVPELLIILVIIVVIFGVGRLPEIGGAIGKSIREFKSSVNTEDENENEESTADAEKPSDA